MLFSSFTFLFCFLPALIMGYIFLPVQARNIFLLVGSLIFYAWGEYSHFYVMMAVVLISYMIGLGLEKYPTRGNYILAIGIALLLVILCGFKYTDFIIKSYSDLVGQKPELWKISLPIGISFYVFQAISYMVDAYRKQVPVQRSLLHMAMYISFFPQLVAGPIVKYKDFLSYIGRENRYICWGDVLAGIRRFVVGLTKKVIIADSMGEIADAVFAVGPTGISPAIAWLGAIAYSLQIFFDFSGYSDMAIGLGRIFGFRFLENFNYPYIAACLTEFWRRWHISLSTWFRDYVYIPLGGNRCTKARNIFNLIGVFFLTGLWHGANWTFVVWGLWHGLFLLIEKYLWLKGRKLDVCMSGCQRSKLYWLLSHSYVLLVIVVGWVIFRADSITKAMDYLKVMFCLGGPEYALGWQHYLHNKLIIVGLIAILLCYPWRFSLIASEADSITGTIVKDILVIGLLLLSLMFMTVGTFSPFIYFKF